MREILFRGKRVDNGEWVYGDFVHGMGHKAGKCYILPLVKVYPKGCNDLDGWEVIPETVGQFTGLLDKHGKKIFEGDKVTVSTGHPSVIQNREFEIIFKDGSFQMDAIPKLEYPCAFITYFEQYRANLYAATTEEIMHRIEVTGTIHD